MAMIETTLRHTVPTASGTRRDERTAVSVVSEWRCDHRSGHTRRAACHAELWSSPHRPSIALASWASVSPWRRVCRTRSGDDRVPIPGSRPGLTDSAQPPRFEERLHPKLAYSALAELLSRGAEGAT